MKKYFTLLILAVLLQAPGWSQTLNTEPVQGPLKLKKAATHEIAAPMLIKKSYEAAATKKIIAPEQGLRQKYVPGQTRSRQDKALDSVEFMRPEGYFYAGLTPNFRYFLFYFLYGPAYSAGNWRNLSGGATSYDWTLPDPDGEVDAFQGAVLSTIQSTQTNPVAYYPFNIYYSNPSLTASDGTTSEEFILGSIDSTLIIAGGSSMSFPETGVGNYDVHKNLFAYHFEDEEDFLFGSSNVSNEVDAVANFFEKPTHTYVLDSIWINATYCTAPPGTDFNLVIHRVDEEGNLTDTIATSSIDIEDVLITIFENENGDDTLYTLLAGQFQVFDPDLGFEITRDYLEISDAIVIELNGFNNNDAITFSVMAQEFGTTPIEENNAYVFYFEDDERYFGSYNFANTSLAFNLGIIYSYLFADDNSFHVSADGGGKIFDVTTYYYPDDNTLWTEEEIPSWLSLIYVFDETDWTMRMKISAEALPSGTSERRDSITIATYGSKFTIYIHQSELYDDSDEDNITNVDNTGESPISLVNRNGEIQITYPAKYTQLMMVDLSGRIVEKHSLPISGTFEFIPSAKLKGKMYLLELSGKSVEPKTLKMVY